MLSFGAWSGFLEPSVSIPHFESRLLFNTLLIDNLSTVSFIGSTDDLIWNSMDKKQQLV